MISTLSLLLMFSTAGPTPSLTTVAEQTSFRRTGRYDEAVSLCKGFEKAYPGRARCHVFGTTPEGRPMVALVASGDRVLDAETARKQSKPVVLWQGGIHSGEIDGKDAGFMLLRDVLDGKQAAGALSRVTVVFVPVVNVDGHERFGPNQRPNQTGPEEMGWRVNAQNLNLNRDYTKVDSPEIAALLRLMTTWDPVLLVDLHVTDGAQFQPDLSLLVEPRLAGAEVMRPAGERLLADVSTRLKAQHHMPLGFYPQFIKDDDPASGFAAGITPPRLAHGYWPMRNRFAVLVEAHSWKDYRTRVLATYDALLAMLEVAARDGTQWMQLASQADQADKKLAGSTVDLSFTFTDEAESIPFPGYAYKREPSTISGAVRIRYDPSTSQVWNIPFHGKIKPVVQATAPEGGYVVPPAYAQWMAEKLKLHGVSFFTCKETVRGVQVEVFRVRERSFRTQPYEGRIPVSVKGTWMEEIVDVVAGSLYVPAGQRGARLVVHLLDPVGPDSFASWGFFHAMFEQKEYLESYVAEDFGEALLRNNPDVKKAFMARLESDRAFAADPAARLLFVHQQHPSWDTHWNRYPVVRTKRAP